MPHTQTLFMQGAYWAHHTSDHQTKARGMEGSPQPGLQSPHLFRHTEVGSLWVLDLGCHIACCS